MRSAPKQTNANIANPILTLEGKKMDAVEANEKGAHMGVVVVTIEGIVEMEENEEDAIDIV